VANRISISVCAALFSTLAACSDAGTPPASTTPGEPSSGSGSGGGSGGGSGSGGFNDASSAGPDTSIEASSPSSDDASFAGTDSGDAGSGGDDASGPPEDAAPADGGSSGTDSSVPPIDGGGGACVLATAWASVASAGCAACQTANCCALVNVCAADPACVAVFNCQQMCYAYLWPDGAPIPKTGGVDDQCATDCITAAPAATQMLFVPQDTCVNTTSCKKACSGG
jgi:hypothetical protein